MNQEIELELTYLAKSIPNEIKNIKPIRITDVYVPESLSHAELRLRQKGNKFEITKKSPIHDRDSSEQLEQTIPLSEQEYRDLASCSKKIVAKDRYQVELAGRPAEVDVFVGDLAGLVLIDFEFDSKTEQEQFIMPDIALADVTQDEIIAGGFLAGKSYSDIRKGLEKYNYRPLKF